MKIWIIILMMSAGVSASAKTLYIKSFKADLLAEAKNSAAALATLSKGEKVEELSKDKLWLQVKHEDKTGWIPSLLLSQTPPAEKVSVLDKDVDLTDKVRKRASGFTSAAAARGLKEDSDDVFKNLSDGNYEQLQQMENREINLEDALAFLSKERE